MKKELENENIESTTKITTALSETNLCPDGDGFCNEKLIH